MEFIKNNRIKQLLIAFLLALPLSCQDPVEGVQVIVDTSKLYDATFTVRFSNVNSAVVTPPENLEVTFSGKDADKIIDQVGNKNFSPLNGFLGLALFNTDNVSPSNPLSFTLVAKAEGFSTATKTVTINDLSELSLLNVEMLDKNNLPIGITVQSEQVSVNESTGESQEDFTITNEAIPAGEESATIEISAGTVLLDENNNPIVGGNTLEVELIQFDLEEEDAVYAMPGGTGAKSVVDENGNDLGDLQFVPAGFVEINMIANNQPVRGFNQPIEIGIELDETTLNPFKNNQPLAVGDIMTIWSIDDGAIDWQYEGEYIITENPETGKLEVNFEVDHLTGFVASVGSIENLETCTSDIAFNISSNINIVDRIDASKFVEVVKTPSGMVVQSGIFDFQNGSVFSITDAPSNGNIKAIIYQGNTRETKGAIIAESSSVSCGDPTTDLNISIPIGTTFNATVSASCANPDKAIPQINVYISLIDPVTGSAIGLGNMEDGKLSFTTDRIELGGTYTFEAVGFDQVVRETITVNTTSISINVDLPADVCRDLP